MRIALRLRLQARTKILRLLVFFQIATIVGSVAKKSAKQISIRPLRAWPDILHTIRLRDSNK